ncbi:glutaminase A [Kurthia gibsonii]|uniref:glutaminase A n=1 Tax=Kurthia gibsonii TaxID=33946 RepID=UPI0031B684A7
MASLEYYVQESQNLAVLGKTASYIPALDEQDPSQFAVCLIDENGNQFLAGDTSTSFTLQSISKVISFIYACEEMTLDYVLQYVDVEPTGDSFNSIIRLENTEFGKPFNPMINAGAITITSLLPGQNREEKFQHLCDFMGKMIGKPVKINQEVYESEIKTADRNRSIAYYLKSNHILQGDVESVLDVYFRHCAIEVTVESLARIGLILSNDGVDPITNERFFSKEISKVAKALMLTCGMYNASGKFATFVGLPSKSGVSGGILSVAEHEDLQGLQGKIGIATFGPAIDPIGNSVAGIEFLKRISIEYDLSIF